MPIPRRSARHLRRQAERLQLTDLMRASPRARHFHTSRATRRPAHDGVVLPPSRFASLHTERYTGGAVRAGVGHRFRPLSFATDELGPAPHPKAESAMRDRTQSIQRWQNADLVLHNTAAPPPSAATRP